MLHPMTCAIPSATAALQQIFVTIPDFTIQEDIMAYNAGGVAVLIES